MNKFESLSSRLWLDFSLISQHELDCFEGGKLSELLLVNLSCLLEDLRKFYE